MVNDNTIKKLDMKTNTKPKKDKTQAPPTKIVIRKLPPTFTEEEFRSAICTIPENNYFKFVPADRSFGPHAFSRTYINFVNPDEIYSFRDRFDGYVFVDQKGNEYPALVEYSPFQKVPKPSPHKKDSRCGSIDEDPDYVAFLDLLQNPETVNLPQIETLLEEIENIEKEARANNGFLKVKTPLLEYVEQRSADRFRAGDKKRRKEYDRKKAREEEKRKRKEMMKEYKKRDDHYSRDERERDRAKKREEERLKWKEKKQEKERQIKKERAERYKGDERGKSKEFYTDSKKRLEEGEEESGSRVPPPPTKEEKQSRGWGNQAQKTKRYSEVRKKEEREKRFKEEKNRASVGNVPKCEGKGENEEGAVETSERGEETEKEEIESSSSSSKNAEKVVSEGDQTEENSGQLELKEEEEEEDEEEEEEEETASTEMRNDEFPEDKNGSSGGGKDPRTERRIRNKDRPAMQLYRPGQSRLKARPKNDKGVDGAESSSSSASPVMGVPVAADDKGGSGGESLPVEDGAAAAVGKKEGSAVGKSYSGGRGYERKGPPHKYSRGGGSHYWEGSEREEGGGRGYSKGGGGGGGRKGYSYHQERENKSKWSARGQKELETTATSGAAGSQFKSLTFRRSTSQE